MKTTVVQFVVRSWQMIVTAFTFFKDRMGQIFDWILGRIVLFLCSHYERGMGY